MKRFINRRVLSRKAAWSVGAVVLAAGVASASLALARPQDGNGPNGGVLKVTNCGPNLSSTVVTQSATDVFNNVNPMPIPNATAHVDAGEGKCVKVLFTAETACGPGGFCYVRAFLDGVPMDPDGAAFQAIDSDDPTASGHAYEWVGLAQDDGPHTVTLFRRVDAAATNFYIDDWTLDVQAFG
jgi:hypothetical protein